MFCLFKRKTTLSALARQVGLSCNSMFDTSIPFASENLICGQAALAITSLFSGCQTRILKLSLAPFPLLDAWSRQPSHSTGKNAAI